MTLRAVGFGELGIVQFVACPLPVNGQSYDLEAF